MHKVSVSFQRIRRKAAAMGTTTPISHLDQEQLLQRLDVFKIHGRDRRGRKILRIIGKFFPARYVSLEVLKRFLEERIYPRLAKKPFSMLYIHTGVQRSENFPGISVLRSICDAVPVHIRNNLEAVYFLHPGLQSRLFLATCGRLVFTGGLYGKVRYVSRVDCLWEQVRRSEVEIPEFVYDQDEEWEPRGSLEYGLETEHPRALYGAPALLDSPLPPMLAMRCIS